MIKIPNQNDNKAAHLDFLASQGHIFDPKTPNNILKHATKIVGEEIPCEIDKICAQRDITLIRRPPYHPEFNAIGELTTLPNLSLKLIFEF